MRRQRIDLGDLGHRRDEAGSHRSPAADQISVIQALFYQQVRDVVNNVVSGADDRIQLPLQSLFHDLRQRIAIFLIRIFITDVTQLLI